MAEAVDRKLLGSLLVMGSVVEARDAYTGGHLWRVSRFARLLAEEMGADQNAVFLAAIGGFLHDFGKIGIPDSILNKPKPLTEAEIGVIRTHPAIGRSIIGEHPLGDLVMDAIAHHHERMDGDGYPDRLAGSGIPLVARIVAICDAFDAMTSTRPYRPAVDIDGAFRLLDEAAGSQFDNALVTVFHAVRRSGKLAHVVGHSHHHHRLAICPHCGSVVAIHHIGAGEVAACRVCGTEFRKLSEDGGGLEATGRSGTPEQLRPMPDFAPIRELVQLAP